MNAHLPRPIQPEYFRRLSRMVANSQPAAKAVLSGIPGLESLRGTVYFYPAFGGTYVVAEVLGLPATATRIYGFHIHEGARCSGSPSDPLSDTGTHFNPDDLPHPRHAGDLPPLFGNSGFAFLSVFTSRFTVGEVLGHTVVIHEEPDDFSSQPAGHSGAKIACGVIQSVGTSGRSHL